MEWPRAGSYDLDVIRPREIRKIADFDLGRPQNSEVTGNLISGTLRSSMATATGFSDLV